MNISSNWTSLSTTCKAAICISIICTLQACSDSDNTSADPDTDTGTDLNNPDSGAALPILLDPYPLNTVSLSDANALNASSAIYRSQQVLTSLAILAADIQTHVDDTADVNASLQTLGNDFCSTGEGSVQAAPTPAFSGAENSVLVSLNACAHLAAETTGEFSVAEFEDDSGNWTIIDLSNVSINIDYENSTETVAISSSRFRSQINAGVESTLNVETVGESVDMVIGGYAIEAAPFESTISRNQDGTQLTVDSRIAITTELLGGTIFGKNSVPLQVDNNGFATSGNFTLQGMDGAVIEWFSGSSVTLPEGFEASSTEVLSDVRRNGEQTFVGNTWAEFLAAF